MSYALAVRQARFLAPRGPGVGEKGSVAEAASGSVAFKRHRKASLPIPPTPVPGVIGRSAATVHPTGHKGADGEDRDRYNFVAFPGAR